MCGSQPLSARNTQACAAVCEREVIHPSAEKRRDGFWVDNVSVAPKVIDVESEGRNEPNFTLTCKSCVLPRLLLSTNSPS